MYRDYYKALAPLFSLELVSYFVINIANAVIVRILGYTLYGDYTLTVMILFSLTPFVACGTTFLMLKILPKLLAEKSDKKYSFLKWNISVILKATAVITVFLILSYFIQYALRNDPHCLIMSDCVKYRHLARDAFYSLPLVLYAIWNSSFFQAHSYRVLSRILGVQNLVYIMALTLVVADYLLIPITRLTLFLCLFISIFILFSTQLITVIYINIKKKLYNYKKILQAITPKVDRIHYRKSALGILINQGMYVMLGSISLLMVELSTLNEATVGHYAAVLYISSITGCISSASYVIIQPYLSSLFDKKRSRTLQFLIRLNQATNTIYFIFSLGLFFLFKTYIYEAYELNFSHMTLTIFSAMTLNYIFSLFSYAEHLCIYNDMNKRLALVTGIEILILISTSYYLINRWSLLGAILASFIAGSWAILASFYILKKSGTPIKTLVFW